MKKLIILISFLFFIFIYANNGIWHWHKKLSFTIEDLNMLARLDFTDIYINAGSFYLNGNKPDFNGFEFDENCDKLSTILNNFNIHLVFTFESWGKHTFYRSYFLTNENAIDFIITTIETEINLFKQHNIIINGIQLDLEGYNIDLDKYKQLLMAIREHFPKYIISFTPMVGWLNDKNFPPLLSYVDYYIPMVYDLQRGRTLFNRTAITDPKWIEKVFKQCDSLKKPFYIGLPSYYYRIYYNEKNHRVKSWTFVNFEELSENRDFKLVESKKNYSIFDKNLVNGDNIYIFEVKNPTFFKYYYFPRGSHLLYDVITPMGLKYYYELVNSLQSNYYQGICLFRFAKKKEPYLVKTEYFPYIFGNQTLLYNADINFITNSISKNTVNFSIIVKNSGNMESMVNKDGVQLLLKIPNVNVITIVKNNFDSYDITKDQSNNTYITFTERFFDLNEELCTGPIILNNSNTNGLKITYDMWILGPDDNYHDVTNGWNEVNLNGNNN